MTVSALAAASAPAHSSTSSSRPWKIVVHHYPDTDAYACAWAAARLLAKNAQHEIVFVRSGEELPAEEHGDCQVIHLDTGKGPFDQHEKELARASSFQLFAQKHGLLEDPGIKLILELTLKADNVERIDPTSIHFILKGLAYHYRDPGNNEVDWDSALTAAFIMLDILYSQAREQARAVEDVKKFVKFHDLPNGLKVADLMFHPRLRQAAFDQGADVVVWMGRPEAKANKGKLYPGVQVHRDVDLKLDCVVAELRREEAKKRNIATKGHDLFAIGTNPVFGKWFLHDSHKLVACGTRSHELLEEKEFTTLSPGKIVQVVIGYLEKLPGKKT